MENNQQIVFSNRLKIALEGKNVKQKDLVKKYEYLSTSLVSKFLNNQKTITNIFAKLCSDEHINIHWIATGDGEMLLNNCAGINVNNGNNSNVAINGTITINTKDYADDEISEVVDLLKYASKPLLDKFVDKLKAVKQDVDDF